MKLKVTPSLTPKQKPTQKPSDNTHTTQDVGQHGESRAAQFYLERGCHILARNWTTASGELDLVVFDPGEKQLVFVEVRALRRRSLVAPEQTVTYTKQRRVERQAHLWLSEHPEYEGCCSVCFDVVGIVFETDEFVHFPCAFEATGETFE